MTRQLALSNKKLRNVGRRLRALEKWSQSFAGYFPEGLTKDERYWHVKIPVHLHLVQGKQTTQEIRAQCAQYLIDAVAHLCQAKANYAQEFKVTCCICLPDMFTSEICIYTSEEYFNWHTAEWDGDLKEHDAVCHRSLAEQWSLKLPEGIGEKGVLRIESWDDEDHIVERWYFGEIS